MSRVSYDGNVKLYFLPACAAIATPTLAEITAGTNLTPYLPRDGITPPSTQNTVDSSSLDETFDSEGVGTWGGQMKTRHYRDNADETVAWDLINYGLTGFLLMSPFGVPIATSKVHVWPVEAHQPLPIQTSGNAKQKFDATWAITSQPDLDAVVAAM